MLFNWECKYIKKKNFRRTILMLVLLINARRYPVQRVKCVNLYVPAFSKRSHSQIIHIYFAVTTVYSRYCSHSEIKKKIPSTLKTISLDFLFFQLAVKWLTCLFSVYWFLGCWRCVSYALKFNHKILLYSIIIYKPSEICKNSKSRFFL